MLQLAVCYVCEEPLTGKQKKFCGNNCRANDFYNKNKDRIRTPKFKEMRRIYLKGWRKKNPNKFKDIQNKYKKTSCGKETIKENRNKYCKKHTHKISAQNKISRLVRLGIIQKQSFYDCPCGKVAENYHHIDYSKPLLVIPMCRICHQKIHNPGDSNFI